MKDLEAKLVIYETDLNLERSAHADAEKALHAQVVEAEKKMEQALLV